MSLKAVSNSSQTYLDWTQRPADLQKKISDDFAKQEKKDGCDSSLEMLDEQFGLFNLDEYRLLKPTILKAYPAQKVFNVLHLGAYNFTWSIAMSKFLERLTDLPPDIKINIYAIRGEKHLGERIVQTDRCTIYNLGAFKVEELFAKFKELGFDLENKVDLAISFRCFRRLNDPVGTLVQTYNLLRPKSGRLFIDGFYFLCNNETIESPNDNHRMTQLFLDIKAPFLTKKFDLMHSLNLFMLKRPNDEPCRLPMSYSEIYHLKNEQEVLQLQTASSFTRFKRKPQSADRELFTLPHHYNIVSGDKSMFDELYRIEGLFFRSQLDLWSPLQAKDEHYVWTPLQTAVASGEYDQLVKLLEEGGNVNEICSHASWKNTALHLSVQKMGAEGEKRYEIFQLILNRGANVNAHNFKGRTPLYEAITLRNDRAFQDLIAAGAYIHDQCPSVLSVAINVKNMSAVKFFIQNKVEMSAADQTKLQGPAFIDLREFLLEQEGISKEAWQKQRQ